jgi:hypothetical protein
MKPLLQRNLVSVMFVVALTVLGFSICLLLIFEPSGKGRLALILVAISSFLTSLSFYLEILRKKRNNINRS